jgi:hypothetical protein
LYTKFIIGPTFIGLFLNGKIHKFLGDAIFTLLEFVQYLQVLVALCARALCAPVFLSSLSRKTEQEHTVDPTRRSPTRHTPIYVKLFIEKIREKSHLSNRSLGQMYSTGLYSYVNYEVLFPLNRLLPCLLLDHRCILHPLFPATRQALNKEKVPQDLTPSY